MIGSILPTLLQLIGNVVDRAIPNKDKAEELKQQLTFAALQLDAQLLQSATNIIMAEAQGGSWLQRNWRPILMLVIIAIVANNYLIYPYLSLFWEDAPLLDLPDQLWGLMKIGVGGYVISRGVEKSVKSYANGSSIESRRNILGMRD